MHSFVLNVTVHAALGWWWTSFLNDNLNSVFLVRIILASLLLNQLTNSLYCTIFLKETNSS